VTEVASVGQSDQGVVNFIVTVELTDADEQVKPGMTAAATITVSELNDILLIPNRAVRTLDGERVVYVMNNGAPVPVPVTLGRSSDTQSEVLESDLQEGDLIVLNPPTDFSQFGPGGQGGPGGGGAFNRRGSP
jgi:HlyD family secretion protein